jgi:cell wall-associated NlpC family hydrolase
VAEFSDEQRQNAAVIISVGRNLGASERDIQIALMAALQESDLRNISYGDRDSVGLFQQRDAWAPLATRMNPYESAKMFFTGGQDGQRGLLDFHNRDQLSLTQAAQAVQVSAYPDAYAKHADAAQALLGVAPQGSSERTAPTQQQQPPASTPVAVPATAPLVAPDPQPAAVAAPGTGEVSAPGTGPTAPGAGEVRAPGAGELTDPLNVPEPQDDPVLDEHAFNQLFPDAQGTFTGMGNMAAGGRRSDIVSAAMGWLGTPYQWGGTTTKGADCSGFVQSLYAQFGINLPRLSADQAQSGQRISLADAQPGDLVGWDTNGRNSGADHIAVFIGNNQIIELPRPGLNARIRSLSDYDTGAWGVRLPQLG